jgi:hypothetical protein
MESSSEEIKKKQLEAKENNNNTSIISINNNEISRTKTINLDKKVIESISSILTEICKENTKKCKTMKNEYLKPFLLIPIPQISIKKYLEHLHNYIKTNSSTIIVMLIYIERLCKTCKFKLTYYNIHKIILAAFLVAIKYNEDEYYSTNFYSKIGGVTKAEIINLEYSFVSFINFDLFITDDIFKKYNYISSPDSDDEDYVYDDDND